MPDETGALSVADAGGAINALLDAEAPKKVKAAPKAKPDPKPEAKAEPPAPVEAPDEEESPYKEEEDDPKAEAKEEEPDDTPDEETEESDEDTPPIPTFKVKVDGQEIEVDAEELKKGYSRTADYTRKTQALAEERKKFDAEEATPLREERRYYAEKVALLEEALEALQPTKEPDWNAESKTLAPEEFAQRYADWKKNEARVATIRAEKQAVLERAQKDEARRLQALVRAERQKLEVAFPVLKDPEKAKELENDWRAYATSMGFTDEDLDGATDSRLFVLLDKARRFDEAQRQKPKLDAKVERAVEAMKPSGSKPRSKPSVLEQAKAKLITTGRIDDAAAVINQMLKNKRE